ncbi:MAG: hypothetical protein K6F53_12480 [Lachnospiraceae bacterium]|nr:hypothetical protein [Lachnospiraceae bacterium]
MKKLKSGTKFIMAFVLIAALIAGVALTRTRVSAAFEASKAMRLGAYQKKLQGGIPPCTMFIGTYLIHKDALTDELYEKAVSSGSDSGQNTIYYKSEMAGNKWRNVSSSTSFKELMENGQPVPDSEIEQLYVQYYVGRDGILIDVVKNQEVNPFNLVDPYDLKKLPELQSLMMQYTLDPAKTSISEEQFLKNRNAKDQDTIRAGVYYYQLLTTFFGLDLSDEDTKKYDEQLDQLYLCYKSLKSAEMDEEADIAYSLMSKVDAARRSIVLEKLSQLDENALGELYNLSNGSYYTSAGNFKDAKSENAEDAPKYLVDLRNAVSHDFYSQSQWTLFYEALLKRLGLSEGNWWSEVPISYSNSGDDYESDEDDENAEGFSGDDSIVDAINDCLESCMDSYNEQTTKKLQDTETVLGHAEYEYSMAVINNASAAGLSEELMNLKHVMNIKGGIISDADGELALLDSEFIPKADGAYSSAAQEGPGGEYLAAVANGDGEAAMKNALNTQMDKLEAKRSELQFFVSQKRRRTGTEAMLADLNNRLTLAGKLKESLPKDAFWQKANGSVDEYISWLKSEEQAVKDADDSMASALDDLKELREELLTKKQAAEDDNDMALAEDYAAQIEALDEQITKEEERLAKERANADGLGDAASAILDLGDSMDALADRLLDNAKSRLNAGDYDGLQNSIDALSAIGAVDALKELQDLMEGSDASNAVKAAVAQAAEDAAKEESLLSDTAQGKDDGSGDGEGEGDGEGDGAGKDDGKGDGKDDGKGDGSGEGKGDGSGAGSDKDKNKAGRLSKDNLLNLINELFGDPDSMDAGKLAATITALSRFAAKGSLPAGELAVEFTGKAVAQKNPYIYTKYKGDLSGKYVSVQTISTHTNYRYIYSTSRHRATLTTPGGANYTFTLGSEEATHGGVAKTLSEKPVFQDSIYIADKDAKDFFGCSAEYVENTGNAVCVTESVNTDAEELYRKFTE